jgi:hypothetical protein
VQPRDDCGPRICVSKAIVREQRESLDARTTDRRAAPLPNHGTRSSTKIGIEEGQETTAVGISWQYEPGIVSMKNQFLPAILLEKRDEGRKDVVTVVLGCKTPRIWKGLDQMKSREIPGNHHHAFEVLNRVRWSLRWFLMCGSRICS